MARVVVSFMADADTAHILTHLTSRSGRATAAKYNALFENLYDRLAVHPDSGPRRPVLGPNVRIGIVPPYIVIYDHEPAADLITVLRIVMVDGGSRATCLSGERAVNVRPALSTQPCSAPHEPAR